MRIVPALFLSLLPAIAGAQVVPAGGETWGPAPAAFPAGAQAAVLAGDPGKAGLFIIRLKMPAGYRVPAHHHTTDEMVTILSGDFALGMGDVLDMKNGVTLHPGGFAHAPSGMNHFAWAPTAAIVEIAAQGPFDMTYVNPADDPRKRR